MVHTATVPIAKEDDITLSFKMTIGGRVAPFDKPVTYKPATINNMNEGTFAFNRFFPTIVFSYFKDIGNRGMINFDERGKFHFVKAIQSILKRIENDPHYGENAVYEYTSDGQLALCEKTLKDNEIVVNGLFKEIMTVSPAVLLLNETIPVEAVRLRFRNGQSIVMQLDDMEYLCYMIDKIDMFSTQLYVFSIYLQLITMHNNALAKILHVDNMLAMKREEEAIELNHMVQTQNVEECYEERPDPVMKNQGNFKRVADFMRKEK